MRVLTLTQPWATLVAIGAKTVETRSWSTPYRGPLAIHAAKGLPPGGRNELRRICRQGAFARALAAYHPEITAPPGSSARPLPLGAIVAVCDLAAVHLLARPDVLRLGAEGELLPGAPFVAPPGEARFGDYTPGRYAWVLAGVTAVDPPVPHRGALGLPELDPSVLEPRGA